MADRPIESAARAAIEAWLNEHAPGFPEYGLCEDGENSWAFWVSGLDTTSYLKADLSVEWYGTGWPDYHAYDDATGAWAENLA